MRQILADRDARLHVETHAEVQAVQESATKAGAIATEAVAGIDVRYKTTIGVQMTNRELIAEQVEVAFREVEQRTDAGISLTIVVTQVTFVVAAQRRQCGSSTAVASCRKTACSTQTQTPGTFSPDRGTHREYHREC